MEKYEIIEMKNCRYCDHLVPLASLLTHTAHCERDIRSQGGFTFCPRCDEEFPRKRLQKHIDDVHAFVTCPDCHERLERKRLLNHLKVDCSQKGLDCTFCGISLLARDLDRHMALCGTRSERCPECGETIMQKYKHIHLESNHGFIQLDDELGADSVAWAPVPQRPFQAVRDAPPVVRVPPYSKPAVITAQKQDDMKTVHLPCEFCDELLPACKLTVHQLGCRLKQQTEEAASKHLRRSISPSPSPPPVAPPRQKTGKRTPPKLERRRFDSDSENSFDSTNEFKNGKVELPTTPLDEGQHFDYDSRRNSELEHETYTADNQRERIIPIQTHHHNTDVSASPKRERRHFDYDMTSLDTPKPPRVSELKNDTYSQPKQQPKERIVPIQVPHQTTDKSASPKGERRHFDYNSSKSPFDDEPYYKDNLKERIVPIQIPHQKIDLSTPPKGERRHYNDNKGEQRERVVPMQVPRRKTEQSSTPPKVERRNLDSLDSSKAPRVNDLKSGLHRNDKLKERIVPIKIEKNVTTDSESSEEIVPFKIEKKEKRSGGNDDFIPCEYCDKMLKIGEFMHHQLKRLELLMTFGLFSHNRYPGRSFFSRPNRFDSLVRTHLQRRR